MSLVTKKNICASYGFVSILLPQGLLIHSKILCYERLFGCDSDSKNITINNVKQS